MRPARPALTLAALAVLLLVADYVFALGTQAGLTADAAAMLEGFDRPGGAITEGATRRLVGTIDVGSLAAFGAAIVVLALARGRPRRALAAAFVIAGANLTTQLLKPALGRLDLLGGEAERVIGGAFPSGHATVAMSVTLALMIVVSPRVRPLAAVVAMTYAGAIGIGMVVLAGHYPSDVIGGYLVATAWAAVAVAALTTRGEPRPATTRPTSGIGVGIAGALAVAAIGLAAAILIGLRASDLVELARYGRIHTTFYVGAAAIAAFAVVLPVSVAALLLREDVRRSAGPAPDGAPEPAAATLSAR